MNEKPNDHLALFDVATLREAFTATALRCSEREALRTSDGTWTATWMQYCDLARRTARGLNGLGIRRGDTVAMLLTNRPEMAIADSASLHLGAVPFSIYATSSPEQLRYVLDHSAARVVVTEASLLARVTDIRASLRHLEHVLCVDANTPETILFDTLAAGVPLEAHELPPLSGRDVATLVYTSGTTGPPKGVEITHANVVAQLRGIHANFPFTMNGRCVSYLPSAHIGDRVASYYRPMLTGSCITFHPDPRTVLAALPSMRPTEFLAMPRTWQKLRSALEARFAASDETTLAAVEEGLRLGAEIDDALERGKTVAPMVKARWEELDERVFAPVRAELGLDAATQLISSAAPIDRQTLVFFAAMGLPIYEAYGMTEASGGITINPPGRRRTGTVGTVNLGTELRLDHDGELLVRGPIVMAGYRSDPAATAAAVDADGWLHTGDIATIAGDGYVTIIDRKKDIIINAAGKNMSPANIENCITSAGSLIGCAMCIGDGRPFNTALLTLEPVAATDLAAHHNLPTDIAELSRDATIMAAVGAAVDRANERLSRVEQIKRFTIVPDVWMPGSELLTPTMKLRRKAITERYEAEIESMYGLS